VKALWTVRVVNRKKSDLRGAGKSDSKQKDWDEVNGEKQEVDSSHKVKHIKKSCRIA